MKASRVDVAATIVMSLSALAAVALLVRREFSAPAPAASIVPPRTIERVEEWEQFAAVAQEFGEAAPAITITVFSDFECPFCRSFHRELQTARLNEPQALRVRFVHFPLSYHRFATAAAVASECAAQEGRFEQFADAAFAYQDSLGLIPWTRIARESGVTHLPAFEECMSSPTVAKRVASARGSGDLIGVDGTPTVLVNEWRLPAPPDASAMKRMIERARAGRTPIEVAVE